MSEATEAPSGKLLLQGLLTEQEFEAETGWKYRTRRRREAEGLPVVVIGQRRYYPIEQARAWILSHMRGFRPEPRQPGRPRIHPQK